VKNKIESSYFNDGGLEGVCGANPIYPDLRYHWVENLVTSYLVVLAKHGAKITLDTPYKV
jgi:hypothetical protein